MCPSVAVSCRVSIYHRRRLVGEHRALLRSAVRDTMCRNGGQLTWVLRSYAGVVKSTKMNRTIIVRRDYLHFVKKYGRCANLLPLTAWSAPLQAWVCS